VEAAALSVPLSVSLSLGLSPSHPGSRRRRNRPRCRQVSRVSVELPLTFAKVASCRSSTSSSPRVSCTCCGPHGSPRSPFSSQQYRHVLSRAPCIAGTAFLSTRSCTRLVHARACRYCCTGCASSLSLPRVAPRSLAASVRSCCARRSFSASFSSCTRARAYANARRHRARALLRVRAAATSFLMTTAHVANARAARRMRRCSSPARSRTILAGPSATFVFT